MRQALARRHHPDKNPGRQQEAEASFKRVAGRLSIPEPAPVRASALSLISGLAPVVVTFFYDPQHSHPPPSLLPPAMLL